MVIIAWWVLRMESHNLFMKIDPLRLSSNSKIPIINWFWFLSHCSRQGAEAEHIIKIIVMRRIMRSCSTSTVLHLSQNYTFRTCEVKQNTHSAHLITLEKLSYFSLLSRCLPLPNNLSCWDVLAGRTWHSIIAPREALIYSPRSHGQAHIAWASTYGLRIRTVSHSSWGWWG